MRLVAKQADIITVAPGRGIESGASPGPSVSAVAKQKPGLEGPRSSQRVETGPVPY
jgi:hypothetical protein